MASIGRSRRCALCQQFYSTGFLDNVPAGELLRARRMLMERSTEDDGPTSHLIREGFDQFLGDLTREREALNVSQRNMPLDVCAFCVQFLPSTYNLGNDEEEVRAMHVGPVRTASPALVPGTRCRSKGQVRSSLVIQHQIPSKKSMSTALGKSPRTARLHRPRSCTPASSIATSPQPPPTYRLLSNDATRVLRIESPAAALHSMAIGQDSNQHRLLAATDVMCSLKAQEQHQTAAILRAGSSKRETYYRHRATSARLDQKMARERAERMTGSTNPDSSQHQNIINALIKGAGTLYTGVVVAQQENKPPTPVPRMNLTASSKIDTKKHGRHFKTELFFPTIPVNARKTPKK